MVRRHVIVWFTVIVAVGFGCTNRASQEGQLVGDGSGQEGGTGAKTRTYSTHVKPVTAKPDCLACHAQKNVKTPNLGTYAFDSSKKTTIKKMVTTNGRDFLTTKQVKNVVDWVEAGAPDDDTKY